MKTLPLITCDVVSGPVQPIGLDSEISGGAAVVFLGRTREDSHAIHGSLQYLEYEAQIDMAVGTMRDLAVEAANRWDLAIVRIQHGTGRIDLGQPSVCIEVLSNHSIEAFEAAHWLIRTLKVRVPIWKCEVWAHGKTWATGEAIETP